MFLFLETAVHRSTETFSGVHVYDCACFAHTFGHLLLKLSLGALQLLIFSALVRIKPTGTQQG